MADRPAALDASSAEISGSLVERFEADGIGVIVAVSFDGTLNVRVAEASGTQAGIAGVVVRLVSATGPEPIAEGRTNPEGVAELLGGPRMLAPTTGTPYRLLLTLPTG